MIVAAARLNAVRASPSMSARARVEALRAGGRKVIDLTIGEPDFDTPEHVIFAGIEALRHGQTRYTGSNGTVAVREAIARKFVRENGLSYAAGEIVVGTGAKQLIYSALRATLNEGDEVVIPAPYWVSYPDLVLLEGGKPVVVNCGAAQGFKIQPAQLEAAITPRTRWLILNSPNNPTGAVYSEQELRALADVLERHPHVWVMTDEIYEHFVYAGASHRSIVQVAPGLRSRALVVNGVSKSYAMTGWRLGYAAGPKELMGLLSVLISQSTSCASSIAQAAAVAALDGPQQSLRDSVTAYASRRKLLCDGLAQIPGIEASAPDGAFYVFAAVQGLLGQRTPDGTELREAADVVNFFIDVAGVATIDGNSYGAPGHVRMCFATDEASIVQACRSLKEACASLGRR